MGVWQHTSKGDHLFRRADGLIQSARSSQNASAPRALSSSQRVKADYLKQKRESCQWRETGRSR